jgi:hypothetical protein
MPETALVEQRKTASIKAVPAEGYVFVKCGSSSGGLCLRSVLETADFALGLGNALLRFENLAIDPIQFTQQFLSANLQVAFHGGVPYVVEIETASVGLLLALSTVSKHSLSDPSAKMLLSELAS